MNATALHHGPVFVSDAAAMQALGQQLGAVADTGLVVALAGALGGGKTTFCQGLARGLGVPASKHVQSPTFALVNQHEGRLLFSHCDLYRVEDEGEIQELGLDEAMDQGVVAIEWAERYPWVLPADHLSLRIESPDDGGRNIFIEAKGPQSAAALARWLKVGP